MKKKPIVQTAELFIGSYLGGVRARAGIPIDQAAKDTRIRVQRLREIESDDFSGFVHPTYVRLFLLDYAAYLGVPIEEIRPMLPDRAIMAIGGFDYLNVLGNKDNMKPKAEHSRPRNRLLVVLIILVALTVLTVVGFLAYLGLRKAAVVLHEPVVKAIPDQITPLTALVEIPKEPLAESSPSPEMAETENAPDIAAFEPVVLELIPQAVAASSLASPNPSPSPTPKPGRRSPR